MQTISSFWLALKNNHAADIILHKIQEESSRYNMKLNQSKCILLGMNSLGSVQYLDGGFMPIADRAPYLGTNMSAKGNPHFEISIRIINTTTTLNKAWYVLEKGFSLDNLEAEST